MNEILRWVALAILRRMDDGGAVVCMARYPDGTSKTTNLDRWMDGKWLVAKNGKVVGWFDDELAARAFGGLL